MLRSLLSAIAGWLVCIAGFTIPFRVSDGSSPFDAVLVVALFSGGPIYVVWLFLLWPLYRRVPFPSLLWHPVICTFCGAVTGAVLVPISLYVLRHPHAEGVWDWPFLCIGASVGTATCGVGCVLRRFDRPRPNNALQRTEAGH